MGDRVRKLAAYKPAPAARWNSGFIGRRRKHGRTGQPESREGAPICQVRRIEDHGHCWQRWRLHRESRRRMRDYSYCEPRSHNAAFGSLSGSDLAFARFSPLVEGTSDEVGIRSRSMNVQRAVFLDRDGVLNEPILRDGRPFPPSGLHELTIVPDAEA